MYQITILIMLLFTGQVTLAQEDSPAQNNTDDNSSIGDPMYPPNLFTWQQMRDGGALLYLVGCLYMFFCLAVIYFEYLLPAIAVPVNKWDLCPEKAAATLWPVAIALPSIFSRIIGSFISFDFIQPGAMVGSAVFHILFSLMVSSFAAWRLPVAAGASTVIRGFLFYLLAIIIFTLFCVDSFLYWWEALILLLVYIVYCIVVHFKEVIEDKICHRWLKREPEGEFYEGLGFRFYGSAASQDQEMKTDNEYTEDNQSQYRDALLQGYKRGCGYKTYWFLALPILAPLWITMPNPNRPSSQNWFVLNILVCTAWIMGISYLMVWWTSTLGSVVGLPAEVMGITFLGLGSNVPLFLTWILLARKGYLNPVLSLALGLNILDLAFETPFTSLIQMAIFSSPYLLVNSRGLLCSMVLLVLFHLMALISFRVCGCRPTICSGVTMIVFYVLFVFITIAFSYAFISCPI